MPMKSKLWTQSLLSTPAQEYHKNVGHLDNFAYFSFSPMRYA